MDVDKEREIERLTAWALGELGEEERAKLEAELEKDAALAAEARGMREAVGAAREWMAAAELTAPGIARADTLAVPAARVVVVRRGWIIGAARAAAATVIFAAGFGAGMANRDGEIQIQGKQGMNHGGPETRREAREEDGRAREAGAETLATPAPTPAGEPAAAPEAEPSETPAAEPSEVPEAEGWPAMLALGPPPDRALREGDRLILESTLPDSGAQVVWVIDSRLKLEGKP